MSKAFYGHIRMRFRGVRLARRKAREGGDFIWPPPVPRQTFEVLVEKLAKYRREGMPVHQQLAVIDWWIGQLFDVRSSIAGGNRLRTRFP